MSWDYAVLSSAAKKAGGPDKLVELIEENGKSIGRKEGQSSMVPWIGGVALGATVLTALVIKLIDHLKAQKAISQAVADEAKAELIQGIKDYDAAHPEEKGNVDAEEGEKNDE